MAAGAALNVIGGNDRGKRFELRVQETRIGRGADQDVVLSDIAVSRRHVTLHLEDGRWRIQDLGSGNGTLVNGQRVESHVLADGDHIEIGQTVMRFEQADARSQPIAYGAPPPVRPMPPAPSVEQPFGPPPPSLPQETPSDAIAQPPPRPPSFVTGMHRTGTLPFGLESPLRQLMVFGGMGLIAVIGLVIILARSVFATPRVVPSEAEELYKQGLRLFAAGDYDGAKISFGEAVAQAPDAVDARRYQRQCEVEIHARAALKSAERALAGRRYVEAVRALADVDSVSLQADEAARLRRENTGRAATEALDEAKRIAAEDPNGARARLEQAQQLDPGNEEVRALLDKARAGQPIAQPVAPAPPPPVAPPAPPPPPPEKPSRAERHHGRTKDPELAAINLSSKREPAVASSGGGLAGQALMLYKAKDFFGAERSVRQESVNQPPKVFQKTIETANQIKQLKLVVDRASAEETAKPDAAIKDYEEAIALDGRLSHGALAGYFKQKIGRLQGALAQQAFAQGKYELAFAAARAAQKAGGSDNGLLKQLEAKAAELVQKGQAQQKANPTAAKNLWHQAMRMVPEGSPVYVKAYSLLNASPGGRRDEDED